MQFCSFMDDPDQVRYCYARASLLGRLTSNDAILTALARELEVPGKVDGLEVEDKLRAIEARIDDLRSSRSSIWHDVPAAEVFSAAIFRSHLPDEIVFEIFPQAEDRSVLRGPVRRWLESFGVTARDDVQMGTVRADVVGHRGRGLMRADSLVGVALECDVEALPARLDEMVSFADYCHAVYLACVPAMAAQYLDKRVEARETRHWDPDALERTLARAGFGLLLVEGDRAYEVQAPAQQRVPETRLEEVLASLA